MIPAFSSNSTVPLQRRELELERQRLLEAYKTRSANLDTRERAMRESYAVHMRQMMVVPGF